MNPFQFKIAWRNVGRNKLHSIIHIAGLATGLATVILIGLFVQDEMQYDTSFKDAGRIFQVNLFGNMDGTDFRTGNTPPTVGPALAEEIPEIESYTRIYKPGELVVRNAEGSQSENYFTEKKILGVDSTYLDLFSYTLLEGDPATCLDQPNSVVLTTTTAQKYFGKEQAFGKTLLFDNTGIPFTVTGILEDPPKQVTWPFDMLTSLSSYPVVKRFSWSWVWLQVNTYVKLKEHVPADRAALALIESKFPPVVKKHAATAFRRIGQPLEEFYKKGGKWDFHLQPLTGVHLHSAGIGSRISTLGDIKYVRIFSLIALFIMVLACVNFMNLSTAKSAARAKEVGIRKVLGSEKKLLVRQFLGEALLFSLISSIVAWILVVLLLHPFNTIAGKELSYDALFSPVNMALVLGLAMITGLMAGSYPAFYLTSVKPAIALKGRVLFKTRSGNLRIRNGLVVFQFAISTALIICTGVVYQQLQFIRSKDLGLNKENILIVQNSQRLGNNEGVFLNAVRELQGVVNVSKTSSSPTQINFEDGYVPEPANADEHIVKEISLPSFVVDENFIPCLDIRILQGRNFSKTFNDSASVILNESAVRQIGWKNPVGMYLQYPGNSQRFRVAGVTKDFNLQSLHSPSGPFALFHTASLTYDLGYSCQLVRIHDGDMGGRLEAIESKWKTLAPATPFDYSFLDEDFNALYRSEQRMGTLFAIFSILSVFVGCLGLFGLAAFTAEKRTREIGVRKILGASVRGLVFLLSKEFIRLVLIAALIAFPVAWWSMNRWLEDFAFRIVIPWWIFPACALLAITIAFLTVSAQAVRAAVVSPVRSLRVD